MDFHELSFTQLFIELSFTLLRALDAHEPTLSKLFFLADALDISQCPILVDEDLNVHWVVIRSLIYW